MATAILQALGGIGDAYLSEAAKRHNAKVAFKRQVKFYRHRYRWQMDDMRKAGLNPILSASSGIGSIPNVDMADTSGPGEANRSIQNYWSAKSVQENVKNVAADTRKKEAEIDTQRDLQSYYQSQKVGQDSANAKADLDLRAAEKYLERQVWENLRATRAKALADRGAARASNAQADTASYSIGGVKVPVSAVPAVKEFLQQNFGIGAHSAGSLDDE